MSLADEISKIYQNHKDGEPFDRLWHWARNGDTKRARFRRFRALQYWADRHAKDAKGEDRQCWVARKKVYRRRKHQILTRIHDGGPKTKLGEGEYAGSSSFIDLIIMPIYTKHGIPPTSRKRWETFGNPNSDHWFGNRNADALDGGIANAQWLHAEINQKCNALGANLSPDPADYRLCYTTVNGKRFRYQGIAATHGTGPHYHAGWRRV